MLNTPKVKKKLKKLNNGWRNIIISYQGDSIQSFPTYGHRFRLKQMKRTQKYVVLECLNISESRGRTLLA